ncbi:MAG: hypothetical protein HQL15_09895, partial [Candidatus Omnitrophica bacterium]|nr:hypothetical protein [Candidatus Omnitrophota bacterium]
SQVYADKNKVAGVGFNDVGAGSKPAQEQRAGLEPAPTVMDVNTIYQRYLQAFKKGVYNYIREDSDPVTNETIPRKYFSGGFSAKGFTADGTMTIVNERTADSAMLNSLGKLAATVALMTVFASLSMRAEEIFKDRPSPIQIDYEEHIVSELDQLLEGLKTENNPEFLQKKALDLQTLMNNNIDKKPGRKIDKGNTAKRLIDFLNSKQDKVNRAYVRMLVADSLSMLNTVEGNKFLMGMLNDPTEDLDKRKQLLKHMAKNPNSQMVEMFIHLFSQPGQKAFEMPSSILTALVKSLREGKIDEPTKTKIIQLLINKLKEEQTDELFGMVVDALTGRGEDLGVIEILHAKLEKLNKEGGEIGYRQLLVHALAQFGEEEPLGIFYADNQSSEVYRTFLGVARTAQRAWAQHIFYIIHNRSKEDAMKEFISVIEDVNARLSLKQSAIAGFGELGRIDEIFKVLRNPKTDSRLALTAARELARLKVAKAAGDIYQLFLSQVNGSYLKTDALRILLDLPSDSTKGYLITILNDSNTTKHQLEDVIKHLGDNKVLNALPSLLSLDEPKGDPNDYGRGFSETLRAAIGNFRNVNVGAFLKGILEGHVKRGEESKASRLISRMWQTHNPEVLDILTNITEAAGYEITDVSEAIAGVGRMLPFLDGENLKTAKNFLIKKLEDKSRTSYRVAAASALDKVTLSEVENQKVVNVLKGLLQTSDVQGQQYLKHLVTEYLLNRTLSPDEMNKPEYQRIKFLRQLYEPYDENSQRHFEAMEAKTKAIEGLGSLGEVGRKDLLEALARLSGEVETLIAIELGRLQEPEAAQTIYSLYSRLSYNNQYKKSLLNGLIKINDKKDSPDNTARDFLILILNRLTEDAKTNARVQDKDKVDGTDVYNVIESLVKRGDQRRDEESLEAVILSINDGNGGVDLNAEIARLLSGIENKTVLEEVLNRMTKKFFDPRRTMDWFEMNNIIEAAFMIRSPESVKYLMTVNSTYGSDNYAKAIKGVGEGLSFLKGEEQTKAQDWLMAIVKNNKESERNRISAAYFLRKVALSREDNQQFVSIVKGFLQNEGIRNDFVTLIIITLSGREGGLTEEERAKVLKRLDQKHEALDGVEKKVKETPPTIIQPQQGPNNISMSTPAKAGASDSAMTRGGIDFNADKMNLQIQNSGRGIKFKMDPAMLAQLQKSQGFEPVVNAIEPLVDLRMFLELKT